MQDIQVDQSLLMAAVQLKCMIVDALLTAEQEGSDIDAETITQAFASVTLRKLGGERGAILKQYANINLMWAVSDHPMLSHLFHAERPISLIPVKPEDEDAFSNVVRRVLDYFATELRAHYEADEDDEEADEDTKKEED